MAERKVQSEDNTTWTCVQAYAGLSTTTSDSAPAADSSKTCTVVCTPSGGEQTVRLELPGNWETALSDEELLQKIEAGRKR